MFKKVVSLMIIAALVVTLFAQQGDYAQGQIDGERDGKIAASPAWVLAGLGCGCIGFGAAYLVKGEPSAMSLSGKSSDYVLSYTDAYKKAKSKEQAKYAGIGWAAYVVVYLVVLLSAD